MKNAAFTKPVAPAAALLCALGLLLAPGCSKKPAPAPEAGAVAKAGEAPPAPKEKETISSADPVARPAKVQPGLSLTVFPNNRFQGPGEKVSVSPTIDFDCAKDPTGGQEVSFRYEGFLEVERDGSYVFQVLSDDESSLYLNGKLALDQPESTMTREKEVRLKAGFYAIRLDYQNNIGPGCLTVRWSSDGRATFTPIPPARLSH